MLSPELSWLGLVLIWLGGCTSIYFRVVSAERTLGVAALPWVLMGVGTVLVAWLPALIFAAAIGGFVFWLLRRDRASEANKRSYARYEVVATYEWADSQDRWHRIDVARVSDGFALGNVRAGRQGLEKRPVFDSDVGRIYAEPSLAEAALRGGYPVNYGVRVVQPITSGSARGDGSSLGQERKEEAAG